MIHEFVLMKDTNHVLPLETTKDINQTNPISCQHARDWMAILVQSLGRFLIYTCPVSEVSTYLLLEQMLSAKKEKNEDQ